MKSTLNLGLALVAGNGAALHVTQWQDSMVIQPATFIQLNNDNTQNFLSAAVDSKTMI